MGQAKDRREMLREFFPLLAAIALQQILALTVNLVDNFMLGRYSEQAMSGAALVNQIQFVVQQLSAGVGAGVAVLGAQYWGKGETVPIKRIIGVGLKFGLAAGFIFTAVTRIFPAQVMSLFTNDPEIIAEAVKYLDIMCWTYLLFTASSVLMYSLQSVQTAFIGMVMSAMTIVINMSLNYMLIYGNLGAPELGVRGAAYATLTSRTVELATILIYVLFIDRKLKMKPADLARFDTSYLGDYIRVSLPVMISGLLWGVAQAAQTAVLGHISAETIAANSIASVIFQLFASFGMSAANAASVMTGKTIGSGRMDLVKPHTRSLQVVFLCLGLVTGALIFAFRKVIVGFYNVSEETRALTVQFLTVLAVSTVGSCYEYPVEGGIIAGGGDTRYQAIVDNLFMWIWTIPMACLCAFVLKVPPVVTFIALKSDQILKCIPNAIKCNRYRWVRDLTRSSADV